MLFKKFLTNNKIYDTVLEVGDTMKYKAYICSKDAEYHIPDDFGGIRIFFSKESIIANNSCICEDEFGCKIVEIEIDIPEDK